jgi:Aspartyl protease
MSRGTCFLLVAFFIGFAFASAVSETPILQGGPMLDCSGLPCVDVTAENGKHLRLLVDTGNVSSILDTAVAKSLGLEVAPANGRDGKPVPGFGRSVLHGVKLGAASLGDVKVLVIGLGDYVKQGHLPAADGTLAYTAFKNRILELDYVRKHVRFSEPLTAEVPCPAQCGSLTTPTFGKQGPPIVVATGFSVNQQPITAQIDTMFSGTMLIYPSSVDKLKLSAAAASNKKQFFPYTDDGVDMLEAQAKTEAFQGRVLASEAPLYFATAAVHLPDGMFDGTVGHGLFEHSVLSLDFRGMKMWMAN